MPKVRMLKSMASMGAKSAVAGINAQETHAAKSLTPSKRAQPGVLFLALREPSITLPPLRDWGAWLARASRRPACAAPQAIYDTPVGHLLAAGQRAG
jgi:hypothetical protein